MKSPEDYMLPCLNKKLFGIDCPGCGMQRSLVLVAKGEFSEAFYMFPAVYTTLLFVIVIILHFILKKKITSRLILIFALLNVIIMFTAYFIKMNNLLNK